MSEPFVSRSLEIDGMPAISVRFFRPIADRERYRCDFEIDDPGGSARRGAFGADEVQALVMAMWLAKVLIEQSREGKAGRITWRGAGELGFPNVMMETPKGER